MGCGCGSDFLRSTDPLQSPTSTSTSTYKIDTGVKIEASPGRKPTTTDDEPPRPSQEQQLEQKVVVRGVLDKRPSYAERFSCLIGLEGSRGMCCGVDCYCGLMGALC